MKRILLSMFCLSAVFASAQYIDNERDATSYSMEETKNLESLPGAPKVIYLNATGYYVYKNAPENIAQMVRIWRQVAADYRPFNVNITTKKSEYDRVGAGNALYLGFNIHYAGGSCPLGLYGRGQSIGGQNCQSSLQFYAVTHESGHGMGIHHHETFENIVGDGWKYVNTHVSTNHNGAYMNHWNVGQVDGGYTNDIELLTSKLGVRADEHGNTTGSATLLSIVSEEVSKKDNNGIIATDGDVDMFKFTTNGGEVDLKVYPLKYYNSLHLKADIVDAEGTVTVEGKPYFHFDLADWPYVPEDLKGDAMTQVKQAAELKGYLDQGTYYIKVTNSGFVDQWGDGYTSYSSLGYYEVEGEVKTATAGNEEVVVTEATVFPNPVENILSIQTDAEIVRTEVY